MLGQDLKRQRDVGRHAQNANTPLGLTSSLQIYPPKMENVKTPATTPMGTPPSPSATAASIRKTVLLLLQDALFDARPQRLTNEGLTSLMEDRYPTELPVQGPALNGLIRQLLYGRTQTFESVPVDGGAYHGPGDMWQLTEHAVKTISGHRGIEFESSEKRVKQGEGEGEGEGEESKVDVDDLVEIFDGVLGLARASQGAEIRGVLKGDSS